MKNIIFEKKNKLCTHLIYDGYISVFESDERTFYEGREQLRLLKNPCYAAS